MNIRFSSIISESKDEFEPYLTEVVYLGGCPLSCGYCYLADLVTTKTCGEQKVAELAAFFLSRSGVQAVSFKGGEPFFQANALAELCRILKNAGIRTKAETSGHFPESVRSILPWLDYICIDVKTKLEPQAYGEITGVNGDLALMQVLKTLAFAEATQYPVFKEIRLTVVSGKNDSAEVVESIASYVSKFCDLFVLQQFQPDNALLDPEYSKIPATPNSTLVELAMVARNLMPSVAIRRPTGVQFVK
ncbi:4Fe-4S cluster-binding domain-containing protein [Candidatus Micrarchaeota archaeon]|nr:4Fe-4S cluster-binding domain-containing protein [Candidatus Micrarchaeota archaeon]